MNDGVCHHLIAGLALGILAAAADASPPERFQEAQALFESAQQKLADANADRVAIRREFYESATRFAVLAQDGIASANLYLNTGNAYHFAGDHARALLWYLRAQKLADTQEARSGLATLRRLCGAERWPRPEASIAQILMFWHYDLSRRVKQIVLLACYPAGCILVTVGLLTQRRRSLWLRLGIALMIVGGVIGVSDVVTAHAPGQPWAVILEPTRGYGGDGEGYSILVEALRPGQEVKVVESRRDWMRIELPSGTRCWVRTAVCETV